jgi:hypothetical protein
LVGCERSRVEDPDAEALTVGPADAPDDVEPEPDEEQAAAATTSALASAPQHKPRP